MRISRIQIENFRNFHKLDFAVGDSLVILGENRVGKTNLLFALRLVLDASLPDSSRQLRIDDFWDGMARPLPIDARIRVAIDIAEFEDDEGQLAVLAEHIVEPKPMVARLTYDFGPIPGLGRAPAKDSDFEFSVYGGDRPENRIGYDLRKRVPMEVLHALRDAEGDLARWARSPLKPLIDRAQADVARPTLESLAEGVSKETDKIAALKQLNDLAVRINDKIKGMAGASQAIETSLGFSPADPDKLLRALKLLLDGKKRDISEASLGTANVLYLALRSLDLDSLVDEGNREHTFFGIEEPEAHLHPHLQRLVYRSYLQPKDPTAPNKHAKPSRVTYLLTTHSPHIASVTPLDSLVLLRKDSRNNATIGFSGASIVLTPGERADIERYLDVTRAEGLFSRGIILVEGDAEKFLLPLLAARAGYDLDSLGISICSVAGTNFAPYVKFFGPSGLNLPVAVVTDLDPYTTKAKKPKDYGRRRAHSLCSLMNPKAKMPAKLQPSGFYESFGIFLNNSTLELALNDAGCIHLMDSVIQSLCSVAAAKKRFASLSDISAKKKAITPITNTKRFLKDIEYVGKGRFAQRLCSEILTVDMKYNLCPPYILKAIKHVIH